VSPIRLDLGRDAKTGVITVMNGAEEKLQLQATAREWTQDAAGQDSYSESGDLVFHPKMMVVDGKAERLVRVGTRVAAAGREKAYRLFIEEIPAPRKSAGANVAIAVRFGVPIFVKPVKEEPKAEIGPIAMDNGTVSARVLNAGNAHFIIREVIVTGKDSRGNVVFSREIKGWYLLAGASRSYATAIPPETCPNVTSVDVEVRTDKSTLAGRLNADRSMCPP
jgi:fimbrial chaperone protein